jgi:four helix bundle protein
MQDFKKLRVWKDSVHLAQVIYRLSDSLPKSEAFGLKSQMRRSVVSISSNIAEGSGRGSALDFARFLQMSIGSASELENQILIAQELGFLSKSTDAIDEVTAVRKQLRAFLQKVIDV